jgi:Holliday junction DNA helicase RuvA
MIGWLCGTVRARDPMTGEVVLDAGGIGHLVHVSWQTFAAVAEVGGACTLWIHTHVREDALALYGFATPAEKRMFLLLTSVPQVGPKLALAVLGGLPLTELLAAIAGDERATLERIPGIGKRTAERILLDLREKVESLRESLGQPTRAPATGGGDLVDEARAVLVGLGWKSKEVDAALDKAVKDAKATASLDALVRRALAQLMSRG